MTPHVVAQANLHAGAATVLAVPPEAGRYRLFLRGGAAVPVEVADRHPEEAAGRVVALEKGHAIEPDRVVVRGGGRIRVEGAPVEGLHVKLERVEWATAAATAHVVSTLPAFRRMFSEDLLRPNVAIRVARVALLFSDLSASTALYTRAGDAKAFGLVQDHFDLLRVEIEANQGTIVKTIGDAVMASFADEAGALRAAVAMQRSFPRFRAEHAESRDVFLKIGVFAGPCYAVSANGVLDYFGQTVNVAARLQGQAHDAEIVVTADEAERARSAGLLDGLLVDPPFVAKLKGVEPDIQAVRIRVP
jgi:class 3 adenylate cyclase